MSLKSVDDMRKEFRSEINMYGISENIRGRKWGLAKS